MSDWAHYYARARAIGAERAGARLRLHLGRGDSRRPMVDFHGREVYENAEDREARIERERRR